MNPFTLDVYANEVMRERIAEAANARLIAQLPQHPTPAILWLGDLARVHVADGLRVLARRLDPTVAPEAAAVHHPEGRLAIARFH
jgi:hypothetical protein